MPIPASAYSIEGSLSIGGISMNRPAWAILGDERGTGGLVRLWAGFDVRGDDRVLPGATGVIAYQRRMTVTRHDLRIIIVGDVDQAGTPVANPVVGLQDNIEYLRTNVLAPVVSATGTRAGILTMPSGATRTADIHVLGLVTQAYQLSRIIDGCSQGAVMIGTLQISIPGGRFA